MKKIVFMLVIFLIMFQAGCQNTENIKYNDYSDKSNNIPQSTSEQSPLLTELPNNEDIDLGNDDLAWNKIMGEIRYSSEQKLFFKQEFVGIVQSIEKKNDNEYIISYDKVELAVNNDSEDDWFSNEIELTEQMILENHVLSLIDPHVGYKAVKMDSLISYISEYEDYPVPFFFYSLDGNIVVIAEMMLP